MAKAETPDFPNEGDDHEEHRNKDEKSPKVPREHQQLVAKHIYDVVMAAVKRAKEEEMLLGVPAGTQPAFNPDLLEFPDTEYDNMTKGYSSYVTAEGLTRFYVKAGRVTLEIESTPDELVKGNFICRKVLANGNSSLWFQVYSDEAMGTSSLMFTQEDPLKTDQRMKNSIGQLLGVSPTFLNPDQMTDMLIFLQDRYKNLPKYLETYCPVAEAKIETEWLMSKEHGEQFIEMLDEVSEKAVPVELGRNRIDHVVREQALYCNKYNPNGRYLSEVIDDRVTGMILDVRYVPIPLVSQNQLVGWTIAEVTYWSSSQDQEGKVTKQRVVMTNETKLVNDYKENTQPKWPERIIERNLVSEAARLAEDVIEEGQYDCSELDRVAEQRNDPDISSAVKELKEVLTSYQNQDAKYKKEIATIFILLRETNPVLEESDTVNWLLSAYLIKIMRNIGVEMATVQAAIEIGNVLLFSDLQNFMRCFLLSSGSSATLRYLRNSM